MAHFLVRHPFGTSITNAILFKIVPDDFVEPSFRVLIKIPITSDKTKGP
jgi:hypothetical protein